MASTASPPPATQLANPPPTTSSSPPPSDTVSTPSLIRLHPPLQPSSLPAHPSLAPAQTGHTAPLPAPFAKHALDQALAFLQHQTPHFEHTGTKKSAGAAAAVTTLRHSIVPGGGSAKDESKSKGKGKAEYWAGRRSVHAGKREAGDATWDEFETGLREGHSVHEMEFTPSVKDAVEVCRWEGVGEVEGWTGVDMAVYEMLHQMPAPLKPRAFTILTLTGVPDPPSSDASASASGQHPFVTLTLPLDLRSSAAAAGGAGKIPTSKYSDSAAVVHGAYVSVERVYFSETGNGEIVWDMVTASDARGNLPLAVQKLGISGAIVKDVGLFMAWVEKRRKE